MNGVAIIYTNKNSVSISVGANLYDFSRTKIKPYDLIESYKQHPLIAPLIEGGKSIEYSAHWLPEAGYNGIPRLAGDGYLIAGDSAMLFNALHREGSNLAMASGKMAAETIIECMKTGDFTKQGLSGYLKKLNESFVLQDMQKYRGFPGLLSSSPQVFSLFPGVARDAAREMMTVNGVAKKQKQKTIIREIRSKIGGLGLMRMVWKGWRSVK
jgi:electron transfer flavoprotein-quinone oxidoreductase